MNCPVCAFDNPEGLDTCENCGTYFEAQGQAATLPSLLEVGAEPAAPAIEPETSAEPTAEAPTAAPARPAAAPVAPAAVLAKLLVKRQGALTGEELAISGQRVMIGRFDPERGPVDLDLSSMPEAQYISRRHAELYRDESGQWFVRDLGSLSGVFVRAAGEPEFGPRITEPRTLNDGDELAFANLVMEFRVVS